MLKKLSFSVCLVLLLSVVGCAGNSANDAVHQEVHNDTILNSADPADGRVQIPSNETEMETQADNKVPVPTDSTTRPVNANGSGVKPN